MFENEEKIRRRIIIPMGLALIILAGGGILGFYLYEDNHLNHVARDRLSSLQRLFSGKIEDDAELMTGLMDLLKKDERLRAPRLAGDREALLRRAAPIFEDLRAKHRVTHFYFHDPNKVNFLRVHNPPRRGDLIDRFTMDEAAGNGKPAQGIELGPFGTFTLRVVHPWWIDGESAGYIELGEEIEHITPKLKAILGVELLFAIDKSFLDRDKWEEGLGMMGRGGGQWDRFAHFVIMGRTMPEIPAELDKH
ncbi:MAG: hypothetical protein GY859_16675, partial [Desulfobacterales bacterium]|nr:hypothetical protein [Desulfobacterales bacterium]